VEEYIKMLDKIGNFIMGVTGICILTIIFVMGLVLFGLFASLAFALLPYVIFGFLIVWVAKAVFS
jgi:hypothetical protein